MQSVLHKLILGVAAVAFSVATSNASAQKGDPWIGAWKINMEKSQFSPAPARFKSYTYTVEQAGKGFKTTSQQVNLDGSTTNMEATTYRDGKDYPLNGNPIADSVSVKQINNLTVEAAWKKAGKVVMTYTNVMAEDGKSWTSTMRGTNPKGETINNVFVYEKQ